MFYHILLTPVIIIIDDHVEILRHLS